MAGNYYVDTFAGSNEALKNLGSAFDSMQEQRRKDELLKIQQAEEARKQAEEARKLSEYNRTEETRQGLAGIDAKRSQMTQVPYSTPNPGLKSYLDAHTDEALAADKYVPQSAPSDVTSLESGLGLSPNPNAPQPPSAEGLASLAAANGPVPAANLTQMRTEQLYGNDELQRQKAQYLEGRGDWAGLKGMENAIDVTSKVDARSADLVSKLHKVAMDARAKGGSTESIRATVKSMAENINRMQGKQVFDPATVDGMDFSPRGDLMMQTMPDGTKIVSTRKTDGTVDFKFVPQEKPVTGKYPGMPVDEKVNGKVMRGQYIFNTPEERAAYEKTGIPRGGNWENNFGDKSTTVVVGAGGMGSMRQAKDLPAGYSTVTRGPNAGQIVKMDFDKDGKPVVRPVTREEHAELTGVSADYKWNQDVPREKQISMIAAVKPRIQTLAQQFKNLNNSDIRVVNSAKNYLKNEFGWSETAEFNSNAKTAVLELTRALTGAGAMSDSRVKMEMSNLDNSASPAQFEANIRNVMAALDSYEKAFKKRPLKDRPAAAGADTRPSITGKNGKKMYLSADGQRWE